MTALLLVLLFFTVVGLSYQYGWWRPSVSNSHPRILMYHMVSEHRPNSRYNKLRVEPGQFERQLEWLRDNGWSFVFMSELIRFPRSKTVALTFDDGYRDNLLQADRLLQKYNAKATLYLVVDRHNRDWSAAKNPKHNDQELMHETKLSDDDVTLMTRSGTLGAWSSHDHPSGSAQPGRRQSTT